MDYDDYLGGIELISHLIEEYQKQLDVVKMQIKGMEQEGTDKLYRSKHRQLKQMKDELQSNIRQMKKYERNE